MEREVETLMGMIPRMRNMLKESDAQEVDNKTLYELFVLFHLVCLFVCLFCFCFKTNHTIIVAMMIAS